MAKETEFNRYIEFIHNNFPTSKWLTKKKHIAKLSLVHSATFDNILIYETFEDWGNRNSCLGKVRFLEDYKEYLSSILIAIPVNHPGFISYLIRSSSESLLKYLYSHSYPEKDEEGIARIPFRHLKDELKAAYKEKNVYQEILNLLNIYGKYSKEIHSHTTGNENSLGTINYYTNNFFVSINKSIEDIISLVNLFTRLVYNVLNFDSKEITFSTLIRLRRNIESQRLSMLLSN